jgi:hypothetical protein
MHIVTDLNSALPGNGSINTAEHATIDEAVFPMPLAPRPLMLTDQWTNSLTRDTCLLCDLRHAALEGLCFLCLARAERIRENTGMEIDLNIKSLNLAAVKHKTVQVTGWLL